jgi:hypothetical protein
MLDEITDLPAGVSGFGVAGRLERADYQDVLGPTVQRAAAGGEERLVIVIPELAHASRPRGRITRA